jgi:hypothetical protein
MGVLEVTDVCMYVVRRLGGEKLVSTVGSLGCHNHLKNGKLFTSRSIFGSYSACLDGYHQVHTFADWSLSRHFCTVRFNPMQNMHRIQGIRFKVFNPSCE